MTGHTAQRDQKTAASAGPETATPEFVPRTGYVAFDTIGAAAFSAYAAQALTLLSGVRAVYHNPLQQVLRVEWAEPIPPAEPDPADQVSTNRASTDEAHAWDEADAPPLRPLRPLPERAVAALQRRGMIAAWYDTLDELHAAADATTRATPLAGIVRVLPGQLKALVTRFPTAAHLGYSLPWLALLAALPATWFTGSLVWLLIAGLLWLSAMAAEWGLRMWRMRLLASTPGIATENDADAVARAALFAAEEDWASQTAWVTLPGGIVAGFIAVTSTWRMTLWPSFIDEPAWWLLLVVGIATVLTWGSAAVVLVQTLAALRALEEGRGQGLSFTRGARLAELRRCRVLCFTPDAVTDGPPEVGHVAPRGDASEAVLLETAGAACLFAAGEELRAVQRTAVAREARLRPVGGFHEVDGVARAEVDGVIVHVGPCDALRALCERRDALEALRDVAEELEARGLIVYGVLQGERFLGGFGIARRYAPGVVRLCNRLVRLPVETVLLSETPARQTVVMRRQLGMSHGVGPLSGRGAAHEVENMRRSVVGLIAAVTDPSRHPLLAQAVDRIVACRVTAEEPEQAAGGSAVAEPAVDACAVPADAVPAAAAASTLLHLQRDQYGALLRVFELAHAWRRRTAQILAFTGLYWAVVLLLVGLGILPVILLPPATLLPGLVLMRVLARAPYPEELPDQRLRPF